MTPYALHIWTWERGKRARLWHVVLTASYCSSRACMQPMCHLFFIHFLLIQDICAIISFAYSSYDLLHIFERSSAVHAVNISWKEFLWCNSNSFKKRRKRISNKLCAFSRSSSSPSRQICHFKQTNLSSSPKFSSKIFFFSFDFIGTSSYFDNILNIFKYIVDKAYRKSKRT